MTSDTSITSDPPTIPPATTTQATPLDQHSSIWRVQKGALISALEETWNAWRLQTANVREGCGQSITSAEKFGVVIGTQDTYVRVHPEFRVWRGTKPTEHWPCTLGQILDARDRLQQFREHIPSLIIRQLL